MQSTDKTTTNSIKYTYINSLLTNSIMQLDFKQLSANQTYFTMIQTIIPRPIAWVLTKNDSGNYNLAPFSYFTAVASDPALLMFSIGKKLDDDQKDTLKNITTKKKLVIHIADTTLVEELNQSAKNLPYGDSELDSIDIETTNFPDSELPRLTKAKVAFSCSLYEIKEIGNKPMSLVFAEIEHAYIADEIVEEQTARLTINAEKMDPLARLRENGPFS